MITEDSDPADAEEVTVALRVELRTFAGLECSTTSDVVSGVKVEEPKMQAAKG